MKKVALITGASSGIGAELARIHAEKGGDLVLVARRQDRLDTLKEELEHTHNVSVVVIAEDLNDEQAPQRIFDTVKGQGIQLDYLINNAGFAARGLFHEIDWSVNRSMIQVNAVALAALTRLFLPDFVARNSGRILNISSTASQMPGPLQAVYFATKAFAAYLSNALVEELRDTGVTVANVMPGATDSEFAQSAGMDKTPLFSQPATARSVAQEAYDAMMRGDMDAYAGVRPFRRFQYALLSLFPKRTVLRIVRRTQEDR